MSAGNKGTSGSGKLVLLVCVFLAVITWIVFGQTLSHGFINYDDPDYVVENAEVTKGLTLHGIGWAFTHSHVHNWHPLTTISHMVDCQLFGLKAGAHHFTNVLLHTVAVLLLFLLVHQFTGALWRSAFVAALFAIHPLHVESVAWVAERKDVLSGVFFMLTLATYLRYVRNPSLASYLLVALVFALGLMSKPMLVTLPFVLLLLDYWPLGRWPAFVPQPRDSGVASRSRRVASGPEGPTPQREVPPSSRSRGTPARQAEEKGQQQNPLRFLRYLLFKKPKEFSFTEGNEENNEQKIEVKSRSSVNPFSTLLLEKLPLLLLSAASCMATLVAQRPGSLSSIEVVPGWVRIYQALVSCVTYIYQMFWPARLALFYPYPVGRLSIWPLAFAIAFLLAVTASAFKLRKHRPYFITGWLWYLGMLVPVLGIIKVGSQAHGDRYTYLPQIGLYLAVTWAVSDLSASWRRGREILTIGAATVIVVLAWCAWVQASYWKNSKSLWTHTLAATGDNATAHTGLGNALLEEGQSDQALLHYQKAVSLCFSRSSGAHHSGNGSPSVEMQMLPIYAQAQYNLGTALFQRGDVDEAILCWQKTLLIQPGHPKAHANLGDALVRKGLVADALAHYEKSLQLGPPLPSTLSNLAWVLSTCSDSQLRNGPRAIQLAEQANQLSGGKNPVFIRTLAAAYAESGRFNDAISAAQRALELAVAKGDQALASKLRTDIDLYRMNFPRREGSPANRPLQPDSKREPKLSLP